MGSKARIPKHGTLLLALIALPLACNQGADEPEADLPIVVEESSPIALGEPEPPTEAEIDIVEEPEPEVITRTVIIREQPRPEPEPEAEAAPEEPAEPAAPTSIPTGTRIPIATVAQIDSEHNEVGEEWSATVTEDIVIDGHVVVTRGSIVRGVVTAMDEGDRTGGEGSITLEARSIDTIAGQRPIAARPVTGGHTYEDTGFPTKETGIGAGAGAVIGGIIGGKKGAAIGGVVGGAGGAAVGQGREDYEVAIDAGTPVVIVLSSPVAL